MAHLRGANMTEFFLKNPTQSRFLNLPISCNTPVRSFSCMVWIRASKNSWYGLGMIRVCSMLLFLGVYIHPKKAQNDGLFNLFFAIHRFLRDASSTR